uniref:Uncharacterized protein n=1 Tax=Lactuca sativa TaxID=4236 RepID=A0A9R1WBH1_LACSA|nr:hypothetical protein LSAT_V11C200053910 [Lactuca sativa]
MHGSTTATVITQVTVLFSRNAKRRGTLLVIAGAQHLQQSISKQILEQVVVKKESVMMWRRCTYQERMSKVKELRRHRTWQGVCHQKRRCYPGPFSCIWYVSHR